MPVRISSGGSKIIRDATAVPGDVRQGKVFYNNDGKQVGNSIALNSITINTKDYSTMTAQSVIPNYIIDDISIDENLSFKRYDYTTYDYGGYANDNVMAVIKLDYTHVCGVKINGGAVLPCGGFYLPSSEDNFYHGRCKAIQVSYFKNGSKTFIILCLKDGICLYKKTSGFPDLTIKLLYY